MAYIFHEDELPKLVSVVPGRERTFFVNMELTNIESKGVGVYLGPSEAAAIQTADGGSLKLFHLNVPRIPA